MSGPREIPTCAVTGRIVGEEFTCGDCDPCLLGRDHVPTSVKRLIGECEDWMNKYSVVATDQSALTEAAQAVVNRWMGGETVTDDEWEALRDALQWRAA